MSTTINTAAAAAGMSCCPIAPQSNNSSVRDGGGVEITNYATTTPIATNIGNSSSTTKPTTTTITRTVIDPLNPKLEVPLEMINPTRGGSGANNSGDGGAGGGRASVPSICLLFLEGRCRQGTDCNQIHVDPQHIQGLRTIAANQPTCCRFHGDVHSKKNWNSLLSLSAPPPNSGSNVESMESGEGGGGGGAPRTSMRVPIPSFLTVDRVKTPMDRLAFTHGLQRTLDEFTTTSSSSSSSSPACTLGEIEKPLVISALFICKLHAGGNCRYGEDCKFIHVCREFVKEQLAGSVSSMAEARVPVANKVQQQQEYHQRKNYARQAGNHHHHHHPNHSAGEPNSSGGGSGHGHGVLGPSPSQQVQPPTSQSGLSSFANSSLTSFHSNNGHGSSGTSLGSFGFGLQQPQMTQFLPTTPIYSAQQAISTHAPSTPATTTPMYVPQQQQQYVNNNTVGFPQQHQQLMYAGAIQQQQQQPVQPQPFMTQMFSHPSQMQVQQPAPTTPTPMYVPQQQQQPVMVVYSQPHQGQGGVAGLGVGGVAAPPILMSPPSTTTTATAPAAVGSSNAAITAAPHSGYCPVQPAGGRQSL